MGGTGTAIPSQGKRADLAARFMVYAKASKEGSIKTWTLLGFDPIRWDAWTDPAMKAPNKFTAYFGDGVFDMLVDIKDEILGTNGGDKFPEAKSLGLPKDLIDSARIDRCNEIRIFFSIMCPVMLPAFAAIMILQAMNSWNSFVWPLIALRSNENMTLPIGLNALLTPYGNNYDVLLEGAVLSVIPIIILFLINQRAFITGLTVGSIKG